MSFMKIIRIVNGFWENLEIFSANFQDSANLRKILRKPCVNFEEIFEKIWEIAKGLRKTLKMFF